MEFLFGLAAIVLLVMSLVGILKVMARFLALTCAVAAVWFWLNGGKEKIETGMVDGRKALGEGAGLLLDAGSDKVSEVLAAGRESFMAYAGNLAGQERKVLEAALVDPASIPAASKPLLRQTIAKLKEQPGFEEDGAARAALETLDQVLEESK